ncbi:MAG TPA: carboxypeptidase regulatory-like domain-containing protein, partial [Pyrinomonadaceae bacterium]|nr:carboxypeptidase regulatory-like domain-containing protein [Pyrinomonadaceae bacterium]
MSLIYKLRPRRLLTVCLGALLCLLTAQADASSAQATQVRVSGRVLLNGAGFGGVSVQVSGTVTTTLTTAADGSYSLTVPPRSNVRLLPQAQFYDFNPSGRWLLRLEADATDIDFTAKRQVRSIAGVVTDDSGAALGGVSVRLLDSAGATLKTLVTYSTGKFNFTNLQAGYAYRVEAASTPVFSFEAARVGLLTANVNLTLQGVRRTYSFGGRVLNEKGGGVSGATVSLDETGRQTTTSPYGYYTFANVTAGINYTVRAAKEFYDFDPPSLALAGLTENRTGVDLNAARQTHEVSGVIHDGSGRGVSDLKVKLTSENSTVRVVATDADGHFSFTGVPAGYSYTLAPYSDALATFSPRSLGPLTKPVTLDIWAGRRLYSIAGRVTDAAGPVAGVLVTVLEMPDRRAFTDAEGNYSLANMKAGFSYTLTSSRTDYKFLPESKAISPLDGNKELNFQALPCFTLGGRVTDKTGKGIFGVRVALSGTESGLTFTDADGNYSFLVTTVGNHTVAPAVEQGYYKFTPVGRSFSNVQSRAAASFTVALAPPYSPSHVLEFDGTPMSVEFGTFWDHRRDLGHFFWEFWAMPDQKSSGGYLVSDGYGGAHAILFGFQYLSGQEPNHYQLGGNVYDGEKLNTFLSDEGPEAFEWGHYAVGWDGHYIVSYFDGVPVGRSRFDGPRRTPGPSGGASRLFVGGSTHSNFSGRMAQLRAYEDRNPREGDGSDADAVLATFAPETVFSREGNLATYFFRPGDPISDLSAGQEGRPHTGIRRSTLNVEAHPCGGPCPIPQFVLDPTAPDFSNPNNPGSLAAPPQAPPSAPANALVYDSFTRANSTYILGGRGGLGVTEGGTLSPLAWRTNVDVLLPQPFGILNDRAVLLANGASATWVETGATSADLKVSVSRRPRRAGTGQNTGLSFRVLDGSNFFFAYTSEGAEQTDP